MVTARWWPSVGGIETHARQWARWLRARGVRVEVLCLDDDPLQSPFDVRVVDDDGVRVTRVAYRYHDHETFAACVAPSMRFSRRRGELQWRLVSRLTIVSLKYSQPL